MNLYADVAFCVTQTKRIKRVPSRRFDSHDVSLRLSTLDALKVARERRPPMDRSVWVGSRLWAANQESVTDRRLPIADL